MSMIFIFRLHKINGIKHESPLFSNFMHFLKSFETKKMASYCVPVKSCKNSDSPRGPVPYVMEKTGSLLNEVI